jgi:hypothetical protein
MSVRIDVDKDKTIRRLKNLPDDMAMAVDAAIMAVALAVEREAKLTLNNNPHILVKNSKGRGQHWEPRGHIGGPGTPPNRRSGNLLRQTRAKRVAGFDRFVAEVGPGVIYGRRLEVSQVEGGFGYPYLRPSADRVRQHASRIASQAFARKWRG